MKKIISPIVLFLIFNLIFTAYSFAQSRTNGRGNSGWGQKSAFNRMYNPTTVETIKGEVVSVDKTTPLKGTSYLIYIMLKTNKETVSVHLGPAWYFKSHNYVINVKDKVEITGSRITYNGKPAVIASEVKRGNEVIKLRDENGYPVWSGSRRK